MANYIRKEVLAEAYAHLAVDIFDDPQRLDQLRTELASFFRERASFIFGTDVEIEVLFEQGSLKSRIIALGSAAIIISGVVAQYSSFRESISALAADAATVAQSANLELIFRTRTPYCDRIRIEKRKGVFGRVQSLLSELDSISAEIEAAKLPSGSSSVQKQEKLVERLIVWEQSADRLFEKFDDEETHRCVAEGLRREVEKIPERLPWLTEMEGDGLRAQIAASDTRLRISLAGVAARYLAARSQILNRLDQRIELEHT